MSERSPDASATCPHAGGRTIVAIRAHRPGSDVDRLYTWLCEAVDPSDIFVVADETRGKKHCWPAGYQVVSFDEQLMEELSIFDPGDDVGWRCGDYCYLALEYKHEFDYLWLIEPDVVANFPFSQLLDETREDPADLVSASHRERDSSWSWYSPMSKLGHGGVYSVFFPLTRVSRRLVGRIREERVRMLDRFSSGSLKVYPNDESVTATVAVAQSYSITDLKSRFPEMFSHFLWGAKWLYPDVLLKFDRPKLVHPALFDVDYAEYLRKVIFSSKSQGALFKTLGTSLWSISAVNYPKWREFVVSELSRHVDESVFNR